MKKQTRACKGTDFPPELLERVSLVLKLLAHPDRLRIFDLLELNGSEPVHAITAALALPQAATSQHLNQMRRIGLIGATRRGKEVWYTIADPRAVSILNCIRCKGEKKCKD